MLKDIEVSLYKLAAQYWIRERHELLTTVCTNSSFVINNHMLYLLINY